MWHNKKIQTGWRVIPNAVAVAGLDAKGVIARTKIGVKSDAAICRVAPVLIVSIEAILEARFIRRDERVSCETDFHNMCTTRRQKERGCLPRKRTCLEYCLCRPASHGRLWRSAGFRRLADAG